MVISGKGGTGKTSILAAFAALAGDAVLADADVDAADLHLLLAPVITRRTVFEAGHEAVIRAADCTGCGACLEHCRFDAVRCLAAEAEGLSGSGKTACDNCADGCRRSCPVRHADLVEAMRGDRPRPAAFAVDPTACEGCGVCVTVCPAGAIDFPVRTGGEWYVSETRHGPLVHAQLQPGGENSGQLVALVREQARALAAEQGRPLVLVDGPPGVGCAAIAAISGATRALVVTEPTPSGAADLARALELTRHFKVPAAVCVNKWDLNPALAARIENEARQAGAEPVGRVRYDHTVTQAQRRGLAAVEQPDSPASGDIRAAWERLLALEETP